MTLLALLGLDAVGPLGLRQPPNVFQIWLPLADYLSAGHELID